MEIIDNEKAYKFIYYIAEVNFFEKNFEAAIEGYKKAIGHLEKIKHEIKIIGCMLIKIGICYKRLESFDKMEKYFEFFTLRCGFKKMSVRRKDSNFRDCFLCFRPLVPPPRRAH